MFRPSSSRSIGHSFRPSELSESVDDGFDDEDIDFHDVSDFDHDDAFDSAEDGFCGDILDDVEGEMVGDFTNDDADDIDELSG